MRYGKRCVFMKQRRGHLFNPMSKPMFSANATSDLTRFIRPEALAAPQSGITDVFTYGWGRPGLIPLWAGEGDMSTPAFITMRSACALVSA